VVEALGVQDGLALRGGEFAEAAKGAVYVAALVGWEIEELLEGNANLLALGWGEVLHPLVVFQQALTLFRRHGIELGEAIEQALLRLRRIEIETGLCLQGFLLLLRCEVAVAAHPLREMLVGGPVVGRGFIGVGAGTHRLLLLWMRCEGAFRLRGSAFPDLPADGSGRGEEQAQSKACDCYRYPS